jgi:hypothetical protein
MSIACIIQGREIMEKYAKLIMAIAALVGAVAWPLAIIGIICFFRTELRLILSKLPILLERVRKASISGVAVELDRVADAEDGSNKKGAITPLQVEAASRIEIQKRELGSQTLLGELDKLCLEYDSLRRTLPSGNNRTLAMTRVVVKMRSLAPSLVDSLDIYKGSGYPGSRLAAITMMQMVPSVADLDWLRIDFHPNNHSSFIMLHLLCRTLRIFPIHQKRKCIYAK